MGFFGNILSSAVKVAVSPLAVATDVVKVVSGDVPDTTVKLLDSAVTDVADGLDDLIDGDL